ncbi:MAG: hypothetical protein R2681_01475 [Pyrinomonadaceae bacterium]
MNINTAGKLVPIVSEDEKLEVIIEDDRAIIRLSAWTDDLGWCGQKTLPVSIDMVDDLHRALMAARYRIHNEKSETGTHRSKVVEFPRMAKTGS